MSGPGKHDERLAALEQRLGHTFADRTLLREAMTHGSALDGAKKKRSYDRLEFLGDRVLGLVVADELLQRHKSEEEGELAPRYNALVNRHACAHAARAADLGAALILSPSEEASGGRGKEAILADVCESVIAAIYLDAGLDAARAFILRFWGEAFATGANAPRDAKTALQEWAAAKKRGLSYVVIEQTGPEHAPHFVVEARIDGFAAERGEGSSKRDAQRAAAAVFLKARGVHD
ncbi:ribonuclease III [Terricaulis sp.]|uniref:ribonuclease III n=1 Tax=Terricaulis sp. TaxID=2768686 RepID=UPI002AC532BA|nr:ribonuclease III [Terricaulis sp.]MDZ4693328.1 ribonuclease III [Terricaulis sp.]